MRTLVCHFSRSRPERWPWPSHLLRVAEGHQFLSSCLGQARFQMLCMYSSHGTDKIVNSILQMRKLRPKSFEEVIYSHFTKVKAKVQRD